MSAQPTSAPIPRAVPPDADPDTASLAWPAVALLAAVQFAAYVDRALPAVTAPLIRADLGLGDAQIGALQGPAFVALYVVGLLAAGQWVAAFKPWRLSLACVAVWTLGAAVFALAPDYGGMVAGRILLGAGQAVFVPAALMLIAGQSEPGRRARGLSLFTTGSAAGRSGALLLGGAALVWLGGGAAGLEGWRAASLALIAPNLGLAGLLIRAGATASPPRPPQRHGGLAEALRIARRRPLAFASIFAAGGACVFVVQAAGAWAPSLLHRGFDLAPGTSALAFGAIVLVCAPLGHLSAGWLMAADGGGRGPAPFLAGAALVAAACAAFLPFAGRTETVLLIAGLTAAGGLAAAAVLIGVQALTPAPQRPAMGALFLAAISVAGVAGGPWLTGLLSDLRAAAGADAGAGLAEALAAAVVGACAVIVALVLAGGRSWRPSPEVAA